MFLFPKDIKEPRIRSNQFHYGKRFDNNKQLEYILYVVGELTKCNVLLAEVVEFWNFLRRTYYLQVQIQWHSTSNIISNNM